MYQKQKGWQVVISKYYRAWRNVTDKASFRVVCPQLKNNIFFSILELTSRKKYHFEEGIEMRQKQKLEKDVFFIEKKRWTEKRPNWRLKKTEQNPNQKQKMVKFKKGTKKLFLGCWKWKKNEEKTKALFSISVQLADYTKEIARTEISG